VLMESSCRLSHLSVGLCVSRSIGLCPQKVYCGKTANWIRMPFGMVSGVGLGIGVLGGSSDRRKGRDIFGVNLGRPIVTNGDFVAWLCESA